VSCEANVCKTCFEVAIELGKRIRSCPKVSFENRHHPYASRLRFWRPAGLASCPALVQHLSSFCPGFVQLLSSLNARSGLAMEDKFHDVLNSINAKPGRSRLERYGELVDELRRQGFTCRDIAALLSEKFQFQTSKSAVNNFVRVRARRRRNARRISHRVAIPPPIVAKTATLHSGPGPSEEEVGKESQR
jgi:hypothetical protein